MPSFTDKNGDSGPEFEGLEPIRGTNLNTTACQKARNANGNGSSTFPPEGVPPKQHRASMSKKLSARPSFYPHPSLSSQTSSVITEPVTRVEKDKSMKTLEDDPQNVLFHQVYQWLQHERSKHIPANGRLYGQMDGAGSDGDDDDEDLALDGVSLDRTTAHGADGACALDKLENILLQYATSRNGSHYPIRRQNTRRRTQVKGLRRGSASESDCPDVESAPPSVDAVLDNSKTLAYINGDVEGEDSESTSNAKRAKDREAWTIFKTEIVRLTHTLSLKGWRKFPMDLAGEIGVVRLSGAMTNAIYVVTPPHNIPAPKSDDGSYTLVPRKPPPKLLLRIYGPQVDHLIDRENELQILGRLGRKNIGPRVLGTFINGRFEEFFEARPLTAKDLRDPGTMKQIAKRMRELHEGIELLEEEREGGPIVFKNWEKWVDRCEQVTNWLDKEIQSKHNETKATSEPWRRRGFVCGVPWPTFRKAVENYLKWLVATYGGMPEIKRQLVFAHNDTQYGNLLRMEPSSKSPLLRPENEHKQLVVIDFEYASANTPGFEFANHFTEWCYNYHALEVPWACNNKRYPTPEEQHRFISAYLTHRSHGAGRASPSITPLMHATSSNMTSVTPLDLNAGADIDSQKLAELEKSHESTLDVEIRSLMKQTRIWRVICSAQWAAWGIVQAKVPGMEEALTADHNDSHAKATTIDGGNSTGASAANAELIESEDDEFDYLAYAQDRAMFFWADLLSMNLIREDELPAAMVEHLKARLIDY
ncbi:hypothetical protein FE257_012217 [Aspergillus nanangensis]|uniref:Choline kinase N-terminal domain-containing protein n=1 Tax=Aspergillus nanangensis TaxID=2582783 RepID=A0AAD4GQX0_ASPNN|nr:hypothetical protein FE257_012217 [Aspergillus nanangensis]